MANNLFLPFPYSSENLSLRPFFPCHREFPHVCSEELAAGLASLDPPPVASVNISFYPRFGWLATALSFRRNFFGRSEPVVPETKETFCNQITEIHHFPAFDSLIVSAPWWAHAMLKIQSVHLIETNKDIRLSKLGLHCFRWRCLVACPTAIHYLNKCWIVFDWTHMNISQWNLKPMSTIFI